MAGFALIGEYRRKEGDHNKPTPAIVRIGAESPDLITVYNNTDFFVLCRDAEEAAEAMTDEWKRGVTETLARLGLPSSEVATAADSLNQLNTRGEAIYWLRDFFQRPILQP